MERAFEETPAAEVTAAGHGAKRRRQRRKPTAAALPAPLPEIAVPLPELPAAVRHEDFAPDRPNRRRTPSKEAGGAA